MQSRVLTDYDLGHASWNQLSKSEYLQLGKWLKAKCISDPTENCISEKIHVEYATGNSSDFKPEEFVKYFSSSSEYSELRISVYSSMRNFSLACDFSEDDMWRGIAVFGEATLPELEDLADEIKQYVENLYMNKIESLSEKKTDRWTMIGVLITAGAFLWAIISCFVRI